jgi:phytoene dehydrogenase-like protein
MADNKPIIIGGGIAGLATGCYARMNGYDIKIFEMHNLPGGCAHLQLL